MSIKSSEFLNVKKKKQTRIDAEVQRFTIAVSAG